MADKIISIRMTEEDHAAALAWAKSRRAPLSTLLRMYLAEQIDTVDCVPAQGKRASPTKKDEPFDLWSLKNIEFAFYDFYEGRSLADVRSRWPSLSDDQLRQIKAVSSSPRALEMMRAIGAAV